MRVFVFLTRRLIFAIILMLGVSAAIFFLINAIGNPIELMMAETPGMTGEVIERNARTQTRIIQELLDGKPKQPAATAAETNDPVKQGPVTPEP